jgi:hypothetical protein
MASPTAARRGHRRCGSDPWNAFRDPGPFSELTVFHQNENSVERSCRTSVPARGRRRDAGGLHRPAAPLHTPASDAGGLARARLHCRFVLPLNHSYIRCIKRTCPSSSEAIIRPNPGLARRRAVPRHRRVRVAEPRGGGLGGSLRA